MNDTKIFIFLAAASILTACGKKDHNRVASPHTGVTIEEQRAQGAYRAILRPLNNSLSGFLPTGVIEISIDHEEVKVRSVLDDDASVNHIQSIHTGTKCPTATDDINGDGVIDVSEALAASGPVFIPLDDNLNAAEKGSGIYPKGRGYTYLKSANLEAFQADAKNRMNQNLNLGGRVVLVHGVDKGTKLPDSVATLPGIEKELSVPVVCGIINRLD
jgi:hypothetical protein